MDTFEPPKYVASLIAAINDGARAAQAGTLAFSAVGIYLLAVAVSTTDEDLLLGHTTSIAQLGVQVAPQISFGIAPFVFVVLHIFTLMRYDMLGTNLRHLRAELDKGVPRAADRERCRQLLANVEFVVALTAPAGSPLYSRLFGWVVRIMVTAFPVSVLLAVQISALRYQNDAINWAQRCALLIDLLVLAWFISRQYLARGATSSFSLRWLMRWGQLLLLPGLVVTLNIVWLNIPNSSDDATVLRYSLYPLQEAWRQPLDLILCPWAGWGCRYLTADNRTLVGRVWKADAVADLRGKRGDQSTALTALEGAFLRQRKLRFAGLSESALYGADLIGADLTGANLIHTDLRGATLSRANLVGADLSRADLTGTNLSNAHLNSANMRSATLSRADLSFANLVDANLSRADLTGANLSRADLSLVDLSHADLTGANLTNAYLVDANLSGATLLSSGLRQEQLNAACGEAARLPPNLFLKPCAKKAD